MFKENFGDPSKIESTDNKIEKKNNDAKKNIDDVVDRIFKPNEKI